MDEEWAQNVRKIMVTLTCFSHLFIIDFLLSLVFIKIPKTDSVFTNSVGVQKQDKNKTLYLFPTTSTK
ncbi:hypothetical protein ACA29_22795 [Lederbergia galactosidilytica]|uniref:Uncharacterized protein n=1 Tax=Lederbergia galactosidilytica TaxID=217031 RepID=A0A0Q9XMR8_9BACI|nr:hypothetical protein ACA29_22795 [Lederbergia galactosidilytica]